MKLTWKYDPNTKVAKCVINESLYYETPDGGQTINKYYNSQLVNVIHKYGDETLKFTTMAPAGNHLNLEEFIDGWVDEVIFLSETYPDIVGKLYLSWKNGFKNKDGNIEGVGELRGFGVNDLEDMLSINRLCIPSNITEWWDWDIIAFKDQRENETFYEKRLCWKKNRTTGEVVRVGDGQSPVPCCVFPLIHGPWPVEESDIEANGGTRIS